ncbi:MAG: U32 family peptidase [Lachnospiraceae bacterium]
MVRFCYCYSGQCLFSSMIGGSERQPGTMRAAMCRLPFQTGRRGAKHALAARNIFWSMKDLCTLEIASGDCRGRDCIPED